jgi:hypothetical protein
VVPSRRPEEGPAIEDMFRGGPRRLGDRGRHIDVGGLATVDGARRDVAQPPHSERDLVDRDRPGVFTGSPPADAAGVLAARFLR